MYTIVRFYSDELTPVIDDLLSTQCSLNTNRIFSHYTHNGKGSQKILSKKWKRSITVLKKKQDTISKT